MELEPNERMRAWKPHWGSDYNNERKGVVFRDLFARIENDLGKVIVDIGSGKDHVTQYLSRPHTVITVDIAGDESVEQNRAHINYDVDRINRVDEFGTKKFLVKIAQAIGAGPRSPSPAQVDTFIFSEILNYVDYEVVLMECKKYLKPGGRIVIHNMPNRGEKELFSEKGVLNNLELRAYLSDDLGLIVEKFDPEIFDEPDNSMVTIVAQKKM